MNAEEEIRMKKVYEEIAKLKKELRKRARLIAELQKECQDLEKIIESMDYPNL